MDWSEKLHKHTGKAVMVGDEPIDCIRGALRELKRIYAKKIGRTPNEAEIFFIIEKTLKEYFMNEDAFEIQDIIISVVEQE